MTQQFSVAPSMKIKTHLTPVSPNELFEHAQDLFDLVARRAYELFENRGGSHGNDRDDWFRAESELLNPVKIDVLELREHLIARAEVPGFNPREIKVCIEPRSLRVSGKSEAGRDQGRPVAIMDPLEHSIRRAERIFGVVELPAQVDPASAEANVKDSTLEVVMPRAAPANSAFVQAEIA
jgi:HSP20 family molecular chaperone IbpA